MNCAESRKRCMPRVHSQGKRQRRTSWCTGRWIDGLAKYSCCMAGPQIPRHTGMGVPALARAFSAFRRNRVSRQNDSCVGGHGGRCTAKRAAQRGQTEKAERGPETRRVRLPSQKRTAMQVVTQPCVCPRASLRPAPSQRARPAPLASARGSQKRLSSVKSISGATGIGEACHSSRKIAFVIKLRI